MTATTTRAAPALVRVYCRHCASPRPLAEVGPGVVVVRHKSGADARFEGLTPAARVWARCGRCKRQQPVIVPPAPD